MRFTTLPPPTQGAVEQLLLVGRRVLRLLERHSEFPVPMLEDALESYEAASLQQRFRWSALDVRAPPKKTPGRRPSVFHPGGLYP